MATYPDQVRQLLAALIPESISASTASAVPPDLAPGSLPGYLQGLTNKYGSQLDQKLTNKLKLLSTLAGPLSLPVSPICSSVLLHTDIEDIMSVVAEFWPSWHADAELRQYADRLFEQAPVKVIQAMISRGGFSMSESLQTDVLALLQRLEPDWNLLKNPLPSDHPAIKDLDKLLDPGRKDAILRFLSALQQLANIVTEPEDLPILVALGFTGFEQVAYTPWAVFAKMLSTQGVDQGRARRIHNEAKSLQARSEHDFVALLEKSSVTQPAALAIPGGKAPVDGNDQSTAISSVKNLSSWFGDLDQVGCEDCCSVTSLAAYFVDLLRFLKNQPATADVTIPVPPSDGSVFNTGSVPRGSILEKLFNRRPDLGDMLLSCRNTNEVVPYVDLVNEVLESALRYLQSNNNKLENSGMKIPAHNADDVERDTQDSSDYDAAYCPAGSTESSSSANKAALPSDAANIDYALYDSLIVHKVAPSSVFPYDHSQDSLERYLSASKTNLPEMVSVFQPLAKSNGPNKEVLARMNASQTLGMSHADFLSLTMESYFDLQLARTETGDASLQVPEYRKLCGLLPIWHYWGYEDKDADAGDGEFDMLQSDSQDPVGPDDQVGLAFIKRQLLPRMGGESLTSLFRILKTDFMCNCLVISVASHSNTARRSSGNIPTQLEGFRLCGQNGEDARTYELQRLEQFVRIWRRLGWSVEATDDALMVFGELPPPDSDLESNTPKGGLVITPRTIKSLAAVRRISDLCKTEPPKVVALFSANANHLRRQVLSRALRHGTTAVAASTCLPLLLATVGMSYDDFVRIQDDEGLGDDLTPDTLWVYYRDVTAANMTGVPYSDLASLLATLSTEATPLSTPETWLKTLESWKMLQADGWDATSLSDVAGRLGSKNLQTLKQWPPALTETVIKYLSKVEDQVSGLNAALSVESPKDGDDDRGKGERQDLVQQKRRQFILQSVQTSLQAALPSLPPAICKLLLEMQDNGSSWSSSYLSPSITWNSTLAEIMRNRTPIDKSLYSQEELQGSILVFSEDVNIHVETSITGDLPIPLDLRGSAVTAFELVPKKATGDGTAVRFECEVNAPKNLVLFMEWPAELFDLKVTLRAAGTDSPNDGESQPAVAIIGKKDVASAHGIIDQLQLEGILLKRYPIKVEEAQILLPVIRTAAVRGAATSQPGLSTVRAMQRYLFCRRKMAKTGYEAQFASFVQWWCSASMTSRGETVASIHDAATRMASSARSPAQLLIILLKANMGTEDASSPVVLESPPGPGRLEMLERVASQIRLMTALGLKEAALPLLFDGARPPSPFGKSTGGDRQKAGSQSTITQLILQLRAALVDRGAKQALEDAQNALRDGRRKALMQYLIQHPAVRRLGIVDESGLFEQFLIDVQMGSGLETTRIKQAISTVQLFVSRALLGREEGIDGRLIPQDRWSWMQRYTFWVANRSTFLYPETWIDPTLRDSKTELFRSVVEEKVMQSSLSDETARAVIRGYIKGADEIGNLRIESFHWEKPPASPDDTPEGRILREKRAEGIFHFIARTRSSPYVFHYRRLTYLAHGNTVPSPSWTPWAKIPFDVHSHSVDSVGKPLRRSGSYVVPVVWQSRLLLFLPKLAIRVEKPKDLAASASSAATITTTTEKKSSTFNVGRPNVKTFLDIKMGWSELVDEVWSSPKESQATLTVGDGTSPVPDFDSFRYQTRLVPSTDVSREMLSVIVFQVGSKSGRTSANTCLGEFTLQGPTLSFRDYATMVAASPFGTGKQLASTEFGMVVASSSDAVSHKTMAGYASDPAGTNSGVPTTWPTLSAPTLGSKLKIESVLWTIESSSDMPHGKYLGLVADVEVSKGLCPEPWFTLPEAYTTAPSQDATAREAEEAAHAGSTMPLYNILGEDFREALSADSGAGGVFAVMDGATIEEGLPQLSDSNSSTRTQVGFGAAFGKFSGLAQCREDAMPHSIYNWEAGFHVVALLVERFMSLQQYDLALQYARLVFDPTGSNNNPPPPKDKDSSSADASASTWRPTWRFPPFRHPATLKHGTLDAILDSLRPTTGAERTMAPNVLDWRKSPFEPHTIARDRPLAYMKRFVIKYIEALVAAGDVFFRQNSIEMLPMAIQRYTEASHIFGPAPQTVPDVKSRKQHFKSYNDIASSINDFSNASTQLQIASPYYVPMSQRGSSNSGDGGGHQLSSGFFPRTRYFGVQANPEFGKLRSLIDDRLFKIRHSLDINGNLRRLSLWDPPLDVGALVNAAAGAGSFRKLLQQSDSMSLLVSGLGQVLTRQRFTYLLHKTFELCEELRRTAGSLLSAMEKKDGEALQLLRSEQDASLQRIMTEMKASQKTEAERGLEQLGQSRRAAAHRFKYYSDLSGEDVELPKEDEDYVEIEQNIVKPTDSDLRLTANELLELRSADTASMLNNLACDQDMMAGILSIIPMPSINMEPMGVGASEQLPSPAAGFQISAGLLRGQAQRSTEDGQRANMIGQWTRQLQDRRLQLNLAGMEVKNIDKQMEVQRERIKTIEMDIRAQQQVVEAASGTQRFLQSKFSNKELYGWLEASSRSIYYQTYLATMTLARKLETAYQFEVGRPVSSTSASSAGSGTSSGSMISPTGYWNESRGGLQAGEQLWLALKQMELSYMNAPRHDFEMTKNISLRHLNVEAMLSLRELGKTSFSLPEMLFDLDCPGQYFRRIQSVAFSLYCVAGPYTNISCNATLVDHRYRHDPGCTGGYREKSSSSKPDPRFLGQTVKLPVSSVALSTGQLDAGVFELNFAGEEYQPFEGAGAISTWELRLPKTYKQFDYKTISDVIIHLRYTAKDGGDTLRLAVEESLDTSIKDAAKNTQTALFDLKNDAPDAWYMLLCSQSERAVAQMRGLKSRLPYLARSQGIKVTSVKIYAGGQDLKEASISLSSTKEQAFGPSAVTLKYADDLGKLEVFTVSANSSKNLDFVLTDQWYIAVEGQGQGDGRKLAPEELLILLEYKFV